MRALELERRVARRGCLDDQTGANLLPCPTAVKRIPSSLVGSTHSGNETQRCLERVVGSGDRRPGGDRDHTGLDECPRVPGVDSAGRQQGHVDERSEEIADVARPQSRGGKELYEGRPSLPRGNDLGGREGSGNCRHFELETALDDLRHERRTHTRLRARSHCPLDIVRREHGPGEHRDVSAPTEARDHLVRLRRVERHLDDPDSCLRQCLDEPLRVRHLSEQDDEPLRLIRSIAFIRSPSR